MKKKFIFISLFVILFFSAILCVKAQERKYEAYGEIFRFDVSESGVNLINPGKEEETGGHKTKEYTYYLDDFTDYVVNIDSTKPFAMYICEEINVSQGPGMSMSREYKYYFFPSEAEKEAYEDDYHETFGLYANLDDCDYFEEKISGSDEKICPVFDSLKEDLEDILQQDKICSDNYCKLKYNSTFYEEVNNMSKVCNVILKYSNYESQCTKDCLKLEETIKNMKKQAGINDDFLSDGHCGFSGKLISWIANIIKWGKYLVPVIVIVLGILDFIKAIAADKEDEMKKAQGRFVKRLIAAALIFIVPFIIEFILDKMGFDAFGCGIIDL